MQRSKEQRSQGAAWWELALASVVFLVIPIVAWSEPLFDEGILVTEREGNFPYHRAVRNAQRYGVWKLGGVPMVTAGERSPDSFRYWTHHPPLVFVGLHAAMALGGQGPLPGRLYMLLAQALTATLVYALLRRRFDPPAAATAGLLLVCARGFAEHGLLVEIFAQPLLLLTTLAVFAWLRYDERPNRTRATAVVLATLAAGACNWQALLLSGFFVIDRVVVNRRLRTRSWCLPLLAVALFAGWTLWTEHQTRDSLAFSAGGLGRADTLSTFAARVNEGPTYLDQPRIGPVEGAGRMLRNLFAGNLGRLALGLFALGALSLLWRWLRREGLDRHERAAVLLFLSPFTFLLMFSRGAIIHPFWTLSGLGGVALIAGIGAGTVARLAERSFGRRAALGAVAILGLASAGFEVSAGRSGWDERLPPLRESQRRHDELAAHVRPYLRHGDHLVVTGHDLRADLLEWQLDRTVHGNLSAVSSLEALRRDQPGALLVALPFEEAGRLPRVVASLLDAPYALKRTTGQPLLLFDLRDPPQLSDRVPAGQENLIRAAAASLPSAPERLEITGAEGQRQLRIVPPRGRVMLFAGTRADHLAPLHDLDASAPLPLSRFPPGRWFLGAATRQEATAGRGVVLSPVTEPVAIEVPLERSYALQAFLCAAGGLLLGAAAYLAVVLRATPPGPGSSLPAQS